MFLNICLWQQAALFQSHLHYTLLNLQKKTPFILFLCLILCLFYLHICTRMHGAHSVGCQSPAEQVELWCFNSVHAGSQGEKKHSPHGQIDSAQYLTAGGTYMDWCQWAMRRGHGTHCKQRKLWAKAVNSIKTLTHEDPAPFATRRYKPLTSKTFTSSLSLLFSFARFFSVEWLVDGSTYFSKVMISLWPVYCRASRRARSLASELKFKQARVTLSYSVTTKYTGETTDITWTSEGVCCFSSHREAMQG